MGYMQKLLAGAGIDGQRAFWVAVALCILVVIWGIARAAEWWRGVHIRLAETNARLIGLEEWARSVRLDSLPDHGVLGGAALIERGAIHDEVTRRHVVEQAFLGASDLATNGTNVSVLLGQVRALSQEHFDEARTEVAQPGTQVVGQRARALAKR